MEWLNNQDRFRGEGKEKWLKAFEIAVEGFKDLKKDLADDKATFQWDAHLVACMDQVRVSPVCTYLRLWLPLH